MTTEEVTLTDRAERVRECADFIVAQLTAIEEERASLGMFGQAGTAKSQADAKLYGHRIAVAKYQLRVAIGQLRTALDEIDAEFHVEGNPS